MGDGVEFEFISATGDTRPEQHSHDYRREPAPLLLNAEPRHFCPLAEEAAQSIV
jgi:hypothetical protein